MIDHPSTATMPGDAMQAALLFCVDPVGLRGAVLRGCTVMQRDAWLRQIVAWLPAGAVVRSVPLNIAEDRLLGGLDLTATLASGRPMTRPGLLNEADGGVLLIHSADRVSDRCTAHLAAALDTHRVVTERCGVASQMPSRIGVLAFDNGQSDDERPPAKLLDRLSFHLDFNTLPVDDPPPSCAALARDDVDAARALFPAVEVDADLCEAICQASMALGIDSMRAPLLTVRVACASAALQGRLHVSRTDAALAVRLVLGPRATAFPTLTPEHEPPVGPPIEEEPGCEPPEPASGTEDRRTDNTASTEPIARSQSEQRTDDGGPDSSAHRDAADILLQAAAARLPSGLLDALKAGQPTTLRTGRAGRAGAAIKGALRGRTDGVYAGELRGGARLNLIETLRAAAPWQKLRRAADANREGVGTPAAAAHAVRVRRSDFRIARFKQRNETTTLFAVDASGSAALHRLAEAKGAVELLLASCYVRRDSVSLIAFRGQEAQVLLPTTRSLVRAKRSLAGLAGGGGTPLATAIDAMLALAMATRRQGRTPVAVLLTDGRANVARDGTGGRERATADALESARRLRAADITSLVIDTSLQPRPPARDLAEQMGAVYFPLPHADAKALSRAVRTAAHAGAGGPRSARA